MTVTSHSLHPPRAFHATLSTAIALDAPDTECHLFVLYTFPQSIIIDTYELVDRRFSFEFWGESNLELPVFALNQTANSRLLINAAPARIHPEQLILDIPVHARYAKPGVDQTPYTITVPSPVCFWACPLSASVSSTFSSKPPIANSTMLRSLAYFSVPSMSLHYASLQVPVASKHDLFLVEMGTATVILVAFLWLVHRSWRVAIVLQSHHLKQQ